MRRFLSSTGFKIFLAVVATLLVGTIAAAVSNNNSAPATSATSAIFGPLQRFSSFISDGLSNFSINFKSSASLSKNNKQLEEEVGKLQEQLVEFEQAKQKLALYEEFLGIKKENPKDKFVAAAVIGRDIKDKFGYLTLNTGSMKKVSVNDPVIFGRYLVGVVTEVMPTQCIVSTLLNPAVNVSAYEVRTRETGFVTTTVKLSKKSSCRLVGLISTTAISPGGIVCTSGIGGIYPRDLIIGTVKEVLDDSENISSYAVIETGVKIAKLEDVFILVDFEGQLNAAQAGE
ncbi:MAG: rod shape-determining protein MreC [Eubacteriales bacterium]